MGVEVLFDTSGFFALLDDRDPFHAKAMIRQQAEQHGLAAKWQQFEARFLNE